MTAPPPPAGPPWAPAPPTSCARWLWSVLWKIALAAGVLYLAAQLLVRSDFFRSRVERELSRWAGMEIRIGRIRATESLNLRIRDTIGISDLAGVEVRLARIRWRLFRRRGESWLHSVRVDGLAITAAPDSEGRIQPAFLAPLAEKIVQTTVLPPLERPAASGPGDRPPETPLERSLALERIRGPLIFRQVSVRWQDAQGNLRAAISGMEIAWVSLEAPNGRRIDHLECRADAIRVVNGPQIRGFHLEMLLTEDGRRFLLRLEAADWGTLAPPRLPGAEDLALLKALEDSQP